MCRRSAVTLGLNKLNNYTEASGRLLLVLIDESMIWIWPLTDVMLQSLGMFESLLSVVRVFTVGRWLRGRRRRADGSARARHLDNS